MTPNLVTHPLDAVTEQSVAGSKHTYVDAVCSYANPQTSAGCESTAGKIAERTANKKNSEHPVFDPMTLRRIHPFDFCALSFERHGFWAKETISFTRKLAHARASALGLNPSAEICRRYGMISCCIQRANAKVLRGDSPGAAFAAAGTLVHHGPRSSAIAVVRFFLLGFRAA